MSKNQAINLGLWVLKHRNVPAAESLVTARNNCRNIAVSSYVCFFSILSNLFHFDPEKVVLGLFAFFHFALYFHNPALNRTLCSCTSVCIPVFASILVWKIKNSAFEVWHLLTVHNYDIRTGLIWQTDN